MKKYRFGATGLQLSRFGIGTMTFGDQFDEKGSHALLDAAYDHGINLYDTANTYNAGAAEEITGKWLKARGVREHIVLTSKVCFRVGGDPNTGGLSPKAIMRELEASLRRLQTDYLDIYFLHKPDYDTPLEVTWRCLDAIVTTGKARYIGMSNYAAWQVVDAIRISRQNGWAPPLVTQFMYNQIARGPEQELLPMTREYDLGNMIYNPLAGGLLTGKHQPGEAAVPGSRLAKQESYRDRYWHPRQREAAEKLRLIAAENGRSPVEFAMRFLMDCADTGNILLGATRMEQFEDTLKSCEAPALSAAEREACDDVWNELHGPVPKYNR